MSPRMLVLLFMAAIMAISFFAIGRYGQAKYDAGYDAARADQSIAQKWADVVAIRELEDEQKKSDSLDDSAADRELRRLGILRQPADR